MSLTTFQLARANLILCSTVRRCGVRYVRWAWDGFVDGRSIKQSHFAKALVLAAIVAVPAPSVQAQLLPISIEQ
jgi:hypothetical protein